MAAAPKHHVTHPNHLLFFHSDDQIYRCNGCFTAGLGRRYRCYSCDFDLHEFCANCPITLSSSSLHPHELNLLTAPLPGAKTCAVCYESISGLFYSCTCSQHCDFNVHPFCTQLPNELHHVIDNKHRLKLHSYLSGSCDVCKTECRSCCYGCDICGVKIHPSCLLKQFDPRQGSSAPSPGGEGSGSRRPWSMLRPSPSASWRWIPASQALSHGAPPYYNGYWTPYYNGYWVHHGHSLPYAQPPSNAAGAFGNSMFSVINNLALGVLSNMIFGSIGSPTFSFF